MRRLAVIVYYDFASSLSYVAHRAMERMADDLEALALDLAWTPIDLTRITGWRRGATVESHRRENALRVAQEFDVPLTMPSRWMDSREVNAVALALGDTAAAATWRECVYSTLYERGASRDAPGLLERLARDVSLDLDALDIDASLAALEATTERARDDEVTGVPTFMLGQWPFGGIQEAFTMRSVLRRWSERQRKSAD